MGTRALLDELDVSLLQAPYGNPLRVPTLRIPSSVLRACVMEKTPRVGLALPTVLDIGANISLGSQTIHGRRLANKVWMETS